MAYLRLLYSEKKGEEGERRKNLQRRKGKELHLLSLDNPLPVGPSQKPLLFGAHRGVVLKAFTRASSWALADVFLGFLHLLYEKIKTVVLELDKTVLSTSVVQVSFCTCPFV